MRAIDRRRFLAATSIAGGAALFGSRRTAPCAEPGIDRAAPGAGMRFGLVTYMWAANWDLPTLIKNCEAARTLGVELRTTHRHGVEPNLNTHQRNEIRLRLSDSPVELVGLGSNERFDSPDPDALAQSIEATKAFVVLSHDVAGSGVKVKPNDFHRDVPREKTIEQIGQALNQVGQFAAGYGQQIRLEVHGSCSRLPDMKAIMDVADHENVALCWNSNSADLEGQGLVYNFNLVKECFGATCHVRPLDSPNYPYPQLFDLLVNMDYDGWVMLEDGKVPPEPVASLARQSELFSRMVSDTQKRLN